MKVLAFSELFAIGGQFVTPSRIFEDLAVHDSDWLTSVHDVEDGPDIRRTDTSEALIRPTEGMGCQNNIVHFGQCILGG